MTAVPVSERFFSPEISKVYFLPTIAAATHIPTRPEIVAGSDLTDEIADVQGWQQSAASIATPDWGHRFISNIPGRKSVDASSITFYADLGGDDIRKILTEGLNGYVLFADGGDVAAYPADVFPVRVSSVGKVRSGGDSALTLTIAFAITRPPAIDIALPTLT